MRVSQEYNLAKLHPNLAKEWHPTKNGNLKPTDVTPGSDQKVRWKCEQEHEWEAKVYDRSKVRGIGCPYCANVVRGRKTRLRALKKSGNLSEKYPSVALEWNYERNTPLKPTDVTPGTHRKVWWICDNRHEWEATVSSRVSGNGCPACSENKKR